MITTELQKQACPNCKYRMECHSSMEGDHVPSPGDFSVCINCAQLLRYNRDLSFRAITFMEVKHPENRKSLRELVSLIKAKNRERN